MSVAPSPVSILVDIADSVNGKRFISAVEHAITQKGRVAFDCEGVDLSRLGTVEIVSVCFPSKEVYLVDFSNPNAEIKDAVHRLLESDTVTKIIHDVKMDADALDSSEYYSRYLVLSRSNHPHWQPQGSK